MSTFAYWSPRPGGSTTVVQGAIFQGLAAGIVGTTDNLINLFAAGPVQIGSVPLADWLTFVNDPIVGTVVTLLQPGQYKAIGWVPWNSGFNVLNCVSVDATLAQRQSGNPNPDPNEIEVQAQRFKLATTIQDAGVTTTFVVDSDEIAAGRNTVRLHSVDPSAGISAPAPGAAYLGLTGATLRLERTGDAA